MLPNVLGEILVFQLNPVWYSQKGEIGNAARFSQTTLGVFG